MKNHRQEQILEILKEKGKVNVHNLSEYFSVTPKTIRRDLEFLEENGELVRIHGGAEMTKTDILRDKPFGVRLNIEAEKKEKIGKEAAMLLKNGQRIFIGAGSTLDYLSSYIDNTNRLYVVTDSITVVNQLNNRSEVEIFMIGGEITKHILGASGTIAENTLKNFWFDMAFISASTVDQEGHLFHRGPAEFGIYKHLAERTTKLVALIDSTKLGKHNFINVAKLRKNDILITDEDADPAFIEALRLQGKEVINPIEINKRRDFMRVHEISSIGKVTLDAFSFYVIIGEMKKAISRRLLNSYYFFYFRTITISFT